MPEGENRENEIRANDEEIISKRFPQIGEISIHTFNIPINPKKYKWKQIHMSDYVNMK